MKITALLVLALSSAASAFAAPTDFGYVPGYGQPKDLATAWRGDINILRGAIPQLRRAGQIRIYREIEEVVRYFALFTDNRFNGYARGSQLLDEWERLLRYISRLDGAEITRLVDEQNDVFQVLKSELDYYHHHPHSETSEEGETSA
ncbi:hypothetical protein FRC02_008702 [Tulasnella sp. 418]|nr:hypothetical protein FRC02_008702 [Tulasnella sp. 418]